MVKSDKKAVKELLNLLKEKKVFVDKLQHSEAEKFINTPKSFVLKGCIHDGNSASLSNVSICLEDAIDSLNEIIDDF